jgi:hypothetical protein
MSCCQQRAQRYYQINFKANCICLDVVVVLSIAPAPGIIADAVAAGEEIPNPGIDGSIITSLSTGGKKLERLKRLKNSALNCALKFSEIRGTCVFLTSQKSNVWSPGPLTAFRPSLPQRR